MNQQSKNKRKNSHLPRAGEHTYIFLTAGVAFPSEGVKSYPCCSVSILPSLAGL